MFLFVYVTDIIQFLHSFLTWLNDWEKEYIDGKIKKSEFLTSSTACGLRVTIQSTLNLSNYLNNSWNFKYLLTGKINQDKLEVNKENNFTTHIILVFIKI